MNKRILALANQIIVVILTFLGFSCDIEEGRTEYGSPNADFKVNGNIVDEATLEKIQNIQVIMQDPEMSDIHVDTSYSDENGFYEVKLNDWPSGKTFVVKYIDIDGVANGEYQPVDSTILFENPEFINSSDSWYQGEVTKTINIKLAAKKD